MSSNSVQKEKSRHALRSIGQAAEELTLKTHVLRYWESKFPRFVKPIKRPDGRRLFRPEDIQALYAIRFLLREQGLTLKGAKAQLTTYGVKGVLERNPTELPVLSKIADAISPILADPQSASASLLPPTDQTDTEGAVTGPPPQAFATDRLKNLLENMQHFKKRLDEKRTDKD